MQGHRRSTRLGQRGQSGAALVEFAVIAPLLLILVLGIIEFGWLFGKFNEVRHATREAGRYAAVSNPDRDGIPGVDSGDVIAVICGALLLPGGEFDFTVSVAGTGNAGDTGTATITATVPSLTNAPIISGFLPSELSSTAEFRIEQPILWTSPLTGDSDDCP